jgi:iron complex outermembrane receptor protein
VLIDGRNVYTPLFAGVYWDVQDMPLNDIDRIEVIRGPGGTIWGPNSGNGVINIITKHADETPGVTGSALAGNQDHTIDELQYDGTPTKQLNFRVFARGFERAHEYHTDGINDDAWHQERGGFRADYEAGRDTFLAEGDAYRGNSPHIVGSTPYYDEVSGGDINLRWERRLSDTNGFYVQTYFERTLRTDPAFLSESRNTIDVEFVHHFGLGLHQHFSYGGGLRFSPYLTHDPEGTDSLVPPGGTDHVHTAFVQDEVALSPAVSFTAGAKLQQNNFSGYDLQPSARVLWAVNKNQSFWAGVTRAVTTPSDLEENFLVVAQKAPHTFLQLLGNKQFKSEDVIGYEAGYRMVHGDRFYLDLSSFFNQYSRLQSFSALTPSVSAGNTYLTIQYQNQIAGHTAGFEFAPRFSIASWWRVSSGYSFVSSTFSADGPTSDISSTGSVNTYEKSTPRHSIFIESKINLPFRVQFDQFYRFNSQLPAQKVGAYQTMDLHAARPLGRDFLVQIVGQNLVQAHHAEWGTGDPTQPVVGIFRAAYIQISFAKHGAP